MSPCCWDSSPLPSAPGAQADCSKMPHQMSQVPFRVLFPVTSQSRDPKLHSPQGTAPTLASVPLTLPGCSVAVLGPPVGPSLTVTHPLGTGQERGSRPGPSPHCLLGGSRCTLWMSGALSPVLQGSTEESCDPWHFPCAWWRLLCHVVPCFRVVSCVHADARWARPHPALPPSAAVFCSQPPLHSQCQAGTGPPSPSL